MIAGRRSPLGVSTSRARVATRRVASVAASIVLATGCASLQPPGVGVPTPESDHPALQAAADAPFAIGGRISARRSDNGIAGSFKWTHDVVRDDIELSTPLGQTIAKLAGDANEVTVHLSDGRIETASDWPSLTRHAFGVTIPVTGLASWVRGVPRPGARSDVERDRSGRTATLRQDGWEIVYAYADDASRLPFRVSLQYPGAEPVEVRVVVDRWE